jgi:hypothetical protein
MADRQTESVWSHLDGEAIEGPLRGAKMEVIPLFHTTWQEWRELHPSTSVLSQDTPFRAYYRNVRIGVVDGQQATARLYQDRRLRSEELVLGVRVEDTYMAYPLSALAQSSGVLNETIGGSSLVVFYDTRAKTAAAFSRLVNGETATFSLVPGAVFLARDNVTGTVWDFTGRAGEGPLKGSTLGFVTSYLSEWYGWSAYHPTTGVYGQS